MIVLMDDIVEGEVKWKSRKRGALWLVALACHVTFFVTFFQATRQSVDFNTL